MNYLQIMSKSTRANLTLRMTPSLQEQLKIKAIQERRSLSDLLEEAALRYLQSTEKSA